METRNSVKQVHEEKNEEADWLTDASGGILRNEMEKIHFSEWQETNLQSVEMGMAR